MEAYPGTDQAELFESLAEESPYDSQPMRHPAKLAMTVPPAKVEHPFSVLKRWLGYVPTSYRGYDKNRTQLFTLSPRKSDPNKTACRASKRSSHTSGITERPAVCRS